MKEEPERKGKNGNGVSRHSSRYQEVASGVQKGAMKAEECLLHSMIGSSGENIRLGIK